MVGSLAPPARATNLRAGGGGFVAVRRTGNEASGAAAAAGGHDGARVAGRRCSRALQRPRCTHLRLPPVAGDALEGVKWPISGWAYSRRRYPNRRFLSSGHPMSRRSTSKPGAGSARIGPAGAPPPESQYDRRPAFRSPNFRTRARVALRPWDGMFVRNRTFPLKRRARPHRLFVSRPWVGRCQLRSCKISVSFP